MCGIVGLIDTTGESAPSTIAVLRDSMAARGPDGTGDFADGAVAMAMRRLAVIDVEHGSQPLSSLNGEVLAFQNGEIYNYRPLRDELEDHGFVFRTGSDTEVLAHGYAHWGMEGLLERIDGMYAIAILDRRRQELHLARDRFGEKPLYYACAKGRFAYGSTLVALAALPWVDDSWDPTSLDFYLALHFIPGERTILNGVRRVLPGERLRIPLATLQAERHRYHRLSLRGAERVCDDVLAERVEAAVVSRLIADVPVGVFLSGGLDSSIVAAIAAKKSPRIDTFSIGFNSAAHDERPYAERVANVIGSTHHHFLFDEHSFATLLPQVAEALDEPLGDQAALPLYWLCKEARRFVTVALSGEGADEVFAGYSYYKPFAPQSAMRQLLARWRRRSATSDGECGRLIANAVPVTPSGFPLLTDIADRQRLTGASPAGADAWETDLIGWLDGAADPLQKASAADLATWLADDLLVKYDRTAMAHSLEGRAPYLDPRVVDLGLHLPARDRFYNGVTKVALRRIAKRWLPADIIERRKQGFVLPMGAWLQQWFEKQGGPTTYFAAKDVPGLDPEQAAAMVAADLQRGVQRERLLFAMVLLVEWRQAFSARVARLREEIARSAA